MADSMHPMSDNADWLVIERYLAGGGEPAEIAQVEHRLARDAALRALMAEVRASRHTLRQVQDGWGVDEMWREVHARILPAEIQMPSVRAHRIVTRRSMSGSMVWRIAATLVLLLVGGWYVVAHEHAGTRVAIMPAHDIVTGRGERATLDLPDGTRIVVAAASRLRIPAVYRDGTRTAAQDLELDGEAYFQVRHDTTRRFRVHTRLGVAEDIGTEFIVMAYPEMPTMQVAVASGEVALHRKGGLDTGTLNSSHHIATADQPLALLEAGDMGSVDASGTASVRRGIDLSQYIAWTSGHLSFNETPLRDVLPALMRWYDVDIHLADSSLAARQVTATFGRGSARDAVRRLEYLLDVRAEWQGRLVTLQVH